MPSDPQKFDRFVDEHPAGTIVTAVVQQVRQFGVFCRLADCVEGLLLVVDFGDPPARFTYPHDYPQVGKTLTVKIELIDREKKLIKLNKRSRPAL